MAGMTPLGLPEKPLTYRLNNGRDVLAWMNEGEPWPFMFANRTQANNRQVALGDDWEVIRPGRPFYVAKNEAA